MREDLSAITKALLDYASTVQTASLFPTVIPEAADFVIGNPYAFCIAICLDRGTKADIIWTIPYDIKIHLGHLDPYQIHQMSLDKLESLFNDLPRRPRYVNAAPRTVQEITQIVVERCGGDASRIWRGRSAAEVKSIFRSVYGVGPGITNMSVLLIEKAFPVRFDDRANMDIKPDVHTKRVLFRLGVSFDETEEAAIDATRRMNPEFPGKVDGALWYVGRNWCSPSDPKCYLCPVSSVCAKRY